MIARIRGRLESIHAGGAVLAIDDAIAYELLLPAHLREALASRVGLPVELWTLQMLESPNQGASFVPRMLGFASASDRAFFELLCTVKGIGARKALRAMAAEPAAIARSIAAKDLRALQSLPEIGKRTAETMVLELTGKLEPWLAGSAVDGVGSDAGAGAGSSAGRSLGATVAGPADDAVSALLSLGLTRAEASARVERALARAGEKADADTLVALACAL